MKKIRTAKHLTFWYFSVVAVSIIIIHASVFELTRADMEQLYGQNKLNSISRFLQANLTALDTTTLPSVRLKTGGNGELDQTVSLYFNWRLAGSNESVANTTDSLVNLPDALRSLAKSEYNRAIEFRSIELPALTHRLEIEATQVPVKFVLDKMTREERGALNIGAKDYFAMKVQLDLAGNATDVIILVDNSTFESSEKQLLSIHTKQIVISLILLLVSLWVVVKIATRLSQPISAFADTLAVKAVDDLSDLPLPEGSTTQELVKMVETFNVYQRRIKDLLERERAFNRYASHELRSPLMVMQGTLTLLGECKDEVFVEKQIKRAQKATNEMTELVETLLELSRSYDNSNSNICEKQRALSYIEIESIVKNHQYLLIGKPVLWEINLECATAVTITESAFSILLGNLIKNAFAHTQSGQVTIRLTESYVEVIDTGMGLQTETSENEEVPTIVEGYKQNLSDGFGLGLLIVRDICHRYSYQFYLNENAQGGHTASIYFSAHQTKT